MNKIKQAVEGFKVNKITETESKIYDILANEIWASVDGLDVDSSIWIEGIPEAVAKISEHIGENFIAKN